MFNATIDVERQSFIIEDQDGNLIAERQMPVQQFPNPGREILMQNQENRMAWARIFDLVHAANEK